MSAIALAGPEDTNVIYTADSDKHLATRLRYRYSDGGNQVTTLDASRYGNETAETEARRHFMAPNKILSIFVSHFDIVIVTNFENASKKTRDALIELVLHRTIDGVAIPGIEAVVFVVPNLESPNVIELQKRAPRDFSI